ncbi:AN1-type zinc finger protein 5-like [Grus japonensis]|uniref:AN1-type zinc finger protein 5-like n=1 Tax=Grus japonensis TaxID=30415 RepID=A0ABC9WE97_GRUJA
MGVHGGADIHLQPMEDPTPEQVEAPEGGCDPVGSPRWSKLLAGPVDPWREEPRLEQGGLMAKCIQEPWGCFTDEAPTERYTDHEESHFDLACPSM